MNHPALKLHILSDLHLEFSNMQPHSASEGADVIVLPGDIWKKDHGIHWARATWPEKEIVYVPGNHEFYGRNRLEVLSMLRIAARETGVHLLDNDEVIIQGTRFLGSTLWTDFELFGERVRRICMAAGQNGLNDFKVIHEGVRHFSPSDAIRLCEESVAWLEMKLKRESFDGPTVVVTHHLPSEKSVAERFKEDLLSACFASNFDHLLGFSELWIHGHTHDCLDYMVEGTRVICNPRGYCTPSSGPENFDFNPALLVEVSKGRCEIVQVEKADPEEKVLMSARQRDAAIKAIDNIQVRTHGDVEFVDLFALDHVLREHVRDIVLTHDALLKGLPDHIAIMPFAVDKIEWLVERIIERAPATKRVPRRKENKP